MRFLSFLIQRSAYSVVLLFVLISLNFFLLHLSPGDIVDTLAGEMGGISEEVKQDLRHHYGLDQPLLVQLFTYLKNTAQGDLGYSFYLKESVSKLVLDRFPATALLFILSLIFSVIIGTFLGDLASIKPDGMFSAFVTLFALAGYAAPAFWVGILLLLAFCVWIPIFPVAGMVSMNLITEGGTPWEYAVDIAKHLVLPLTTLSIICS